MIKNFFISIIFITLLFSCGKKGDPVYNEKNNNSELIRTQQSAIS
jgi:hypothetical protein